MPLSALPKCCFCLSRENDSIHSRWMFLAMLTFGLPAVFTEICYMCVFSVETLLCIGLKAFGGDEKYSVWMISECGSPWVQGLVLTRNPPHLGKPSSRAKGTYLMPEAGLMCLALPLGLCVSHLSWHLGMLWSEMPFTVMPAVRSRAWRLPEAWASLWK